MARRLEKQALAGAFARGPKPELEFLVPEKPKKGRKRKQPEPAPEPSPAPAPTVEVPPPAPDPAPEATAPFARVLTPPPSEPPRATGWSPGAPPIGRLGLRWRLERRWDALVAGLLRGTLGWV